MKPNNLQEFLKLCDEYSKITPLTPEEIDRMKININSELAKQDREFVQKQLDKLIS